MAGWWRSGLHMRSTSFLIRTNFFFRSLGPKVALHSPSLLYCLHNRDLALSSVHDFSRSLTGLNETSSSRLLLTSESALNWLARHSSPTTP